MKSLALAVVIAGLATAAALDLLGPDFTYETRLYAFGQVIDSVLYGYLAVRGSGDPSIGGRFDDGDRTATFRAWADSLRMHGIARIEGDILGDDDVFDDVALGVGWNWDVGCRNPTGFRLRLQQLHG